VKKIAPNIWYATGEEHPYARVLYFGFMRWWIGVGLKWRVCSCCRRKHAETHWRSAGLKGFRFGFLVVTCARVR
jgi:hypothetical protein